MKKLHFDYSMDICYEEEVSKCNFTIKCIPQNTERQKIENIMIDLYPCDTYRKGVDGLRNLQIYGPNHVPHKTFHFQITGDATVGLSDFEEFENEDITMIFKHAYGLNKPGPKIEEYHKKVIEELQSILSKDVFESIEKNGLLLAKSMMHLLHRDFKYVQNTTTVQTTAEEAFAQGCGVCQDYAHIFIALLQLSHIPSRYVTGLIIGEGASHAWVEILQDHKWYGLDPTNDKMVADEHIKIGIGRDAHDCMINRGIMHGGGSHSQTIKVNVTE